MTEFWGIESNPKVETLREAIRLGKEKNIDFLLAVGGGSVIDGTKLISAGLLYEGDAWELVRKGMCTETVPLAAVLTIPATGSEMNNGAVISRKETAEKFAFYSNNPVFSILDPTVTFSLPKWQVACGIADTFVHVMEQYMTAPGQSRLMDRWAEGILLSLIEIAPEIVEKQDNYERMADFMLCATMGLNHFIGMGVREDWATHLIGSRADRPPRADARRHADHRDAGFVADAEREENGEAGAIRRARMGHHGRHRRTTRR